jgi:hypothetical protein
VERCARMRMAFPLKTGSYVLPGSYPAKFNSCSRHISIYGRMLIIQLRWPSEERVSLQYPYYFGLLSV